MTLEKKSLVEGKFESHRMTYDELKDAAEKAGLTPDMDASAICDAMKTAMTEITYDGLTGSGMTWSADGEPNKAPKAVVIKDGAYTAQ